MEINLTKAPFKKIKLFNPVEKWEEHGVANLGEVPTLWTSVSTSLRWDRHDLPFRLAGRKGVVTHRKLHCFLSELFLMLLLTLSGFLG